MEVTDDLLSRVDALKATASTDQADHAARAAAARELALAADPVTARWLAEARAVFAGAVFKGFVEGYAEKRPDVFNAPGGPPDEEVSRGRFK